MTAPRPSSPRADGTFASTPAGSADGASEVDAPTGPPGSRIPALAGTREEVPSLEVLRGALRGSELPLPAPRTVPAAAARVLDLVHAGRLGGARYLGSRFREVAAPPAEHAVLLRALLAASLAAGDRDDLQDLVVDLVSAISRAGAPLQARATAEVLGPRLLGSPDAASADLAAAPAHGRRRGMRIEPGPEILAVVRSLELPRPEDPRVELPALEAAMSELPAVADDLAEDPWPLFASRRAQDLEALDRPHSATRQALDVLDRIAADQAEDCGLLDAARVESTVHAVLARTLVDEHPLAAVGHSLRALTGLRDVEDPVLRVGLISDLLRALVRSDLQDHAALTAGRLASLTRTLPRDDQRIAPLLSVGAQRVSARRYDGAEVVLREARRLSTEARDRRSRFEAVRLLARLHHEQGHGVSALEALRQVALDARGVADDLATSRVERLAFVRAELDAEALVLRRALDLGRPEMAAAAARAVIRRVQGEQGGTTLPAPLLWDHEVDARVGALIAEGTRIAEGDRIAESGHDSEAAMGTAVPGATATAAGDAADGAGAAGTDAYAARLQEAGEAIDRAPAGHEARARFWRAYLDDRHAAMLAARGERTGALVVGRRARRAWRALGREEEAQRMKEELVRWGAGGPPRHAGPHRPESAEPTAAPASPSAAGSTADPAPGSTPGPSAGSTPAPSAGPTPAPPAGPTA